MDGTFDDESEPAVTIGEYLEEVEERELVSHFLHPCYIWIYFICLWGWLFDVISLRLVWFLRLFPRSLLRLWTVRGNVLLLPSLLQRLVSLLEMWSLNQWSEPDGFTRRFWTICLYEERDNYLLGFWQFCGGICKVGLVKYCKLRFVFQLNFKLRLSLLIACHLC